MLEPDQWDMVLGSITGTVYRGTERISSNALLNLAALVADRVRVLPWVARGNCAAWDKPLAVAEQSR
jgi:hypothetical protein